MSNSVETAAVESVKVRIFNQTYHLRSQSGGERIVKIAQLVDERMLQISSQLATHDALKVAVLAALNIADELQRMKEGREEEEEQRRALAAALHEQSASTSETLHQKEQPQASWFDAIFDSELPTRQSRERLSTQISAKLQSMRQADGHPPALITDIEEE